MAIVPQDYWCAGRARLPLKCGDGVQSQNRLKELRLEVKRGYCMQFALKFSSIEILQKNHLPVNMKDKGLLSSSCVFLIILLSTLLDQANSLMCWQNSNSVDNPWDIQECDTTVGNETTCLAQYRVHNGVQRPSYFGCHTPNTPCSRLCSVTEGQSNDYSCCCSGDLCNSVPGLTPNTSTNSTGI